MASELIRIKPILIAYPLQPLVEIRSHRFRALREVRGGKTLNRGYVLVIGEDIGSAIEVPTAPDAPSNFSVSYTSPDAIFTWGSVEGVDGYDVYVKIDDGEYTKVNEELIEGTEFIKEYLDVGVYSAYVVAVLDELVSNPSTTDSFEIEEVEPGSYNSLLANGSTQYVDLGTLGDFGDDYLHTFTLECWIQTTSTSLGTLVGVVNDGSTEIFAIYINSNNNEGYLAGSICLQIRNAAGTQRRMAAHSAGINDGDPHHIAISNFEGTFRIYVDGTLQSLTIGGSGGNSTLNTPNYNNFGYPLTLFARNVRGSFDRYLAAQVSDLRIWSDLRSSTEIDDNMDARLTLPQSDLFLNYQTESAGGNTLEDILETYDGTLVNNSADNMWSLTDLVQPA